MFPTLTSSLGSIRTLLLAIFLIMVGGGFLSTLIAVRLEQSGASAPVIGLVATAYFAGLTAGSLRAVNVIKRVGHIRAFAVFVAILSASSLAYALGSNAVFWIVLRFIDGLMTAGVFICLESWLNDGAEPHRRSSVLASYMAALYLGQAAGQFLLTAGQDSHALPFMYSAIVLSLAALPVLLTKIDQPHIEGAKLLTVKRLYAISPLGFVGVSGTGMMLGAFYALGPLFAQKLGMGLPGIALFTSCVIAGGVLLQWPFGMMSDKYDRRVVIIGTFSAAMIVCGLIVSFASSGIYVFAFAALFGGMSFTLYPMCVAHFNDRIDGSERVGASSGLVLAYSVGAIVGPMLGAVGVAIGGPAGLFGAIGLTALLVTIFGLWRMCATEAVPNEEQGAWQSLPRTTPMATIDVSSEQEA